MRFVHMVAVVAVLASGAEVQAQSYDNILIRWSPPLDIDEPFWPEARDDKGEILWRYNDEFSSVWTSVADEAYNNHHTRQWAVGEFEYWMSNRTPPPVEDGPTVGGTLHHYDGTLDFHSGRRYTASGSVTQVWDPEVWGIIEIPILADHEGHELKINGESVFRTEIGQRFYGSIQHLIMEGNEELRLEWSGQNDAADIKISPAKFYPSTTVPEPSLGGLIDAIGSGIGGLLGW